jgi:hypothetical protein
MEHSAIEAWCRTRPLRIIDQVFKELNPRLHYRLLQFRAGPDDSCVEEILMT